MSWLWHRTTTILGAPVNEHAETPGMAPPPGEGWTLVPGQGPGLGEVPGLGSFTPTRQSSGTKSRRPKEYRSFDDATPPA